MCGIAGTLLAKQQQLFSANCLPVPTVTFRQLAPTGVFHRMLVFLQMVIEALRNELQQYGEMLALLDQQRQLAPKSGADEVLRSISSINAQGASIQAAREQRQRAQQRLAKVLQQPRDAKFSDLIPLLPDSYQPLVSALVQENNDLLGQVRERAQENQHLLRRSVELMQRFIITLAGNEQKAQSVPQNTTVLPLEPSSSLYAALV